MSSECLDLKQVMFHPHRLYVSGIQAFARLGAATEFEDRLVPKLVITGINPGGVARLKSGTCIRNKPASSSVYPLTAGNAGGQ